MMDETLVTARFDDGELRRLESAVGPVARAGYGFDGVLLTRDELLGRVSNVRRLIVEFEQVDDEVLASAPALEVLACCRNEPAASVDLEAAHRRGITVLFTPGRNANAVAEYTVGLVLCAARGIAAAHHALRYTDEFTRTVTTDRMSRRDSTAQWSLDPGAPFDVFQGPELAGRTLGMIGFGLIGQKVAQLLRAFGMSVLVFDPYVGAESLAIVDAQRVDIMTLARTSDVVAVAAKVTSESRGVVSRGVLEAMPSHAYFVNTARAALVDYDALVDVLAARSIAGAALDVYPEEPLPGDSPLLALGNVVLTPHLAGASTDVVRHHSRQVVDDLLRLERGENPQYVATSDGARRRSRPLR
ncbi:MAG: NAD(P)-dependent oxidoreductase [Mycobacteriales bacterium]